MGARQFKLPHSLSDADSDAECEAVGQKHGRGDSQGNAGPVRARGLHDGDPRPPKENPREAGAESELDSGLLVWQCLMGVLST